MANYFIYDGTSIVNFILADTKEIAEEVTGMTVILDSDAPEGMNIGWKLIDGLWINPNPDIIDPTV
jgi:hypothetical protein